MSPYVSVLLTVRSPKPLNTLRTVPGLAFTTAKSRTGQGFWSRPDRTGRVGWKGTEMCLLERRIWPISLDAITLHLPAQSLSPHQQGHSHLGSVS